MSRKGRLIMVRHGQTPANVSGIWHGSTDTPLTEVGHHQAGNLAAHFHRVMIPDVIYASPLQRAHNTAKAIADIHNLSVNLDPRLAELSLGEWEGYRFEDIRKTHDPEGLLFKDPHFTPPRGESQLIVKKRIVAAIEEILDKHRDENVVMVSHGVTLGIAIAHYLHEDTTRWMEYHHENTAYTEFCPIDKKLVFFNKTDHYSRD